MPSPSVTTYGYNVFPSFRERQHNYHIQYLFVCRLLENNIKKSQIRSLCLLIIVLSICRSIEYYIFHLKLSYSIHMCKRLENWYWPDTEAGNYWFSKRMKEIHIVNPCSLWEVRKNRFHLAQADSNVSVCVKLGFTHGCTNMCMHQ